MKIAAVRDDLKVIDLGNGKGKVVGPDYEGPEMEIVAILAKPYWESPPTVTVKGGPGSGHHGHVGRPGKVGGSLPGKGDFQPGTAYDIAEAYNSGLLEEEAYGMPHSTDASKVLDSKVKNVMVEKYTGGFLYTYSIDAPQAQGVKVKWSKVPPQDRADMKDEIIKGIAKDIGMNPEDMTVYSDINAIIAAWADTSNKSVLSAMIQSTASEEFGVPLSDYQKEYVDGQKAFLTNWIKNSWEGFATGSDDLIGYMIENPKDISNLPLDLKDEFIDYLSHDWGSGGRSIKLASDLDLQKKVIRAVYNRTQSHLASLGFKPDDTIILFRGGNFPKGVSEKIWKEGRYKGNSLESWSASYQSAGMFGEDLVSMRVPVRNIFSTAVTGTGCWTEGEFIIFGSVGENAVLNPKDFGDFTQWEED